VCDVGEADAGYKLQLRGYLSLSGLESGQRCGKIWIRPSRV
jgi:hypothetical protein